MALKHTKVNHCFRVLYHWNPILYVHNIGVHDLFSFQPHYNMYLSFHLYMLSLYMAQKFIPPLHIVSRLVRRYFCYHLPLLHYPHCIRILYIFMLLSTQNLHLWLRPSPGGCLGLTYKFPPNHYLPSPYPPLQVEGTQYLLILHALCLCHYHYLC